jgi:hypothetical protein
VQRYIFLLPENIKVSEAVVQRLVDKAMSPDLSDAERKDIMVKLIKLALSDS